MHMRMSYKNKLSEVAGILTEKEAEELEKEINKIRMANILFSLEAKKPRFWTRTTTKCLKMG